MSNTLQGPLDSWKTASPESQGIDRTKLDALRDDLAERATKAFLVVKNDRIVYEWYAPDHGPSQRHYTASLAKALVGGVSLLVALNDERIGVDDPAWKYIPMWKDSEQKSKITVRHLATHSSGIEDALTPSMGFYDQSGWKEAFWRARYPSSPTDPDPFSIALTQAPLLFSPGTRYAYSNPGFAALSYAITASLKDAPQSDIGALLKERIMDPIGVPESEWSIGYGHAYELDGMKLYANWGGGEYTARAVARVGQFMLHRGQWQGRPLVDAAWVDRVISYAGTPLPDRPEINRNPASGLGWWINFDGIWSAVPRDAFAGAGNGQQVLLVVPSVDLIVVRNGEWLGSGVEHFWGELEKYLFDPLMDAIVGTLDYSTATSIPPYPPSQLIRKVTFAPISSIVRKAIDSDNWPITWADDDHQYTAYGDGWGFEPRTEQKLSNGFAKIFGSPTGFQGVNIHSASGETEGDGKDGPKASGMLMVAGVLYMWVRNVENSQLAWSEDHGETWEWGFRFDTSFGCPTFLNFGRNYQGARDGFVYVYSQDGPSAYEPYDQVVMARVPKERICDLGAYEFFEDLDESGGPIWTSDIARRGPVFRFPGHCQRLDVVYHACIKRYLLALGFNMRGGWGIFDAPEPWGPWTTAFYTTYWGLGCTHGYRLPRKWISADGKTMHLVFSGRTYDGVVYDAFCVRKLHLDVNGQA